jgi:hypothetical protein
MGINFDDMKNKAKDALGQHSDKAEQGVDKASEAAKSRFGEHSDKIDSGSEKAKNVLNSNEGGGQPGGQQQPPQ